MPYRADGAVAPSAPVLALAGRVGASWPAIAASHDGTAMMRARLTDVLGKPHLVPPDTTLVVFGSLARGEFTRGSDVDWTLLVDGPADAYHPVAAQRIAAHLRELGLPQPAPGGPFGSVTFSHELIHKIGGDDDTNRTTTQRLLLLLESASIGNAAAYDRVVAHVLARYVEEDMTGPRDRPNRVPRFLHNDITRYWRTMAVDFAHKRRARGEAGWALRNAKLRMSRKLMYAAGLLSCYSCDPSFHRAARRTPWNQAQQVVEHLSGLVRATPLDIVARVMLYFGGLSGVARQLFGAYDQFLGILDDPEQRTHLETLASTHAEADPVYQRVRALGGEFQDALTELFFTADTPVRELTIRYGVF